MNRLGLFALLAGLLLALPHALVARDQEQAPTSPDAVLKTMLRGVEVNDVDLFTQKAEPDLKNRITKEVMTRLSNTFSSRIKRGYTATSLGQLRQQGVITYLYKIEFKDGSDDVLVRMAVRDGLVAGLFFE